MLNFDWLDNVAEVWARIFIIAAFFIPLVFAFTMKKAYIMKGTKDKKRWRDLRFWILFLVLFQTWIYIYF